MFKDINIKKNSPPKRQYGNGSIYAKNNGRGFEGAIYVMINGVRKRKKASGRTKAEVRNKLKEIQVKAQAGEFNQSCDVTFREFAEQFIERRYILENLDRSTVDREHSTLKKLSSIAEMQLSSITEQDIENFYIENIDLSQSYLNKIHGLLKRTYTEAVNKKLVLSNPMSAIKKPKSHQEVKKVRALTLEEESKLLKILKTEDIRYSEIMLLMLFLACRPSEVTALEVKDVDFENKLLTINKTVARDQNGRAYVKTKTKTDAGMRTLILSDEILEFFQVCIGDKKEGRIFSNKVGGLVTATMVNSQFRKIKEKYDILDKSIENKKVVLYSCRHTGCTRMFESGLDYKLISHNMGHSSIDVTLDTYTDLCKEYKTSQMTKYDDFNKEKNLSIR